MDLGGIFSGSGKGRGWTLATLVVFGILIALFIGSITGVLSYGIASSLNMTATVSDVFSDAFNDTRQDRVYIKVGNYTAVIPHNPNPVLDAMQGFVIPLLVAFVTLVSNPMLLAMVIAVTLIVVALEVEGKL